MPDNTDKRPRMKVPPFLIPGAILIFLPIIFFITYQNIKQQQAHTQSLLLEKGAALIRSFEAGTRAGMRGRMWGNRKLQQLLEETAQQPDIAYLLVTNQDGIIVAHNKTDQIGTLHKAGIQLKTVLTSPDLKWRIVEFENNIRIFEVYKQFVPTGVPGNPSGVGMRHRFNGPPAPLQRNFDNRQTFQVIFIGLEMKSLDEATESTIINSIITGILLFVAGLTGIVLLFLFQNYQSAKTSLSMIKAFSDNLVDNMPIGLVALDANQIITSVNATAEEVLSKPANILIGEAGLKALPSELHSLLKKVDHGGKLVGQEIDCRVAVDKTIPLEISISLIRDDNQQNIGYALLLKDLTEIHHLRKEVLQSQKLASLGRLAAGVAHEIRNPLSSIKGFATYFRDRYREVDKDRQTANVMINEVDRLDRVVGQLLELARPIQIIPQETEVGAFIKESTHVIEQKIRDKDIELIITPQSNTCNLYFDRDKISQVLLNLYLNAIDAMEPQGLLKLGYWHDTASDTVHFTIVDSGKGIDQKDLAKIFDPYYTTKPTGTGLGLAIVHNILEAHQGKINVESTPGKGTAVTIVIPNFKQEQADDR